jgi:steroid 5-alpha reductase family enzyme
MLSAIGTNLWVSAVAVLVFFAVTYRVSVLRGRHDTVDTAWGLGFGLVALVSLGLSRGDGDTARAAVITALTLAWGVRLAVHLQVRNGPRGEDPRYQRMLSGAHGSGLLLAIRKVYVPQAVVLWIVSMPVLLGQYGPDPVRWSLYLGVAVWLLGFAFETIGDAQLARFRRDPANSGAVLDTGLWRYTRHPNYFGDACVWWGLWVLAAHSIAGVISVFSPVIMTLLLAKGTGKPMLETGMEARHPGYADYVRRTSGFVPLPPKKTEEP